MRSILEVASALNAMEPVSVLICEPTSFLITTTKLLHLCLKLCLRAAPTSIRDKFTWFDYFTKNRSISWVGGMLNGIRHPAPGSATKCSPV